MYLTKDFNESENIKSNCFFTDETIFFLDVGTN
jgi:hypothetical protein